MKVDDTDIITISFYLTWLIYPMIFMGVSRYNIDVMIFPIIMLLHSFSFWGLLYFLSKRKA